MKKHARRLTALALALVLAFAMTGQTASASWALGEEKTERTVTLAEGVTFTNQSLWSASKSDLRTEHYITYNPNSGGAVRPVVYSGDYVPSLNTVAAAAAQLKAQGCRVAAAVNGGFFNSDGTIVGMLMTDGVVRSLDVVNYALLGFTKDGKVFIDESEPIKTVSWQGTDGEKSQVLSGFNAYRNSIALGGLYLYNRDFGSQGVNKDSSRDCVAVVLTAVSGEGVTMNGTLTLSVEQVMDTKAGDTFNRSLADGRYMLYANYYNGNDGLLDGLRSLTPGQWVTVSVSGVSEQWADAAYGISSPYCILRNNEIVSGLSSTANPYTAVGVKANGTAVFYTIDGRQSGYSVGATYAQVAERLKELGCVTAVALDGGGSTTLGATLPGSGDFTVQNQPSTSGRRVNNSILLVVPDSSPTGVYAGAYVSAPNTVVLAEAELPVTAVPYDTAGYPMTGQELVWNAPDGGIVRKTDSGAVFSSATTGIFRVSADRGGSEGALPVRVVDKLSSLRVTREGSSAAVSSLTLKPGDTVDLTASGTWWNLPVAMNDSDVTWSADASVGTIDETGRFQAVERQQNASGNITAAAGGKTVTVSVTVQANHPFTDVENHWSADYVGRLYGLGITQGIAQPDGTFIFNPSGELSRGELLTFITRLLGVDTDQYQDVTLPFADADTIPGWMLPYVKAMYDIGVLTGISSGGKLYANVNDSISREMAMTMLGRILADQVSQDLSGFDDSGLVSDWARPYIATLVGLNVVQGSGGKLNPKSEITRGETAKLLVELSGLDKAAQTRLQPDE